MNDRQSDTRAAVEAEPAWIDVSLPIRADSVAWAGLAQPTLGWDLRIDAGATVNVGHIALSTHTATHADAPLHVAAEGADIASLDPGVYIGRALLLHVHPADLECIDRAVLAAAGIDFEAIPKRLLLATDQPYDGMNFPEESIAIDPAAARDLVAGGLRLIGVDQPSVDPLDSRDLPAHHALLGGGAYIVENLQLAGLEQGWYDLVAVPLRIIGADASPIRALVRPIAL